MTRVWQMGVQAREPNKSKADVEHMSMADALEPDPSNRKEAMRHERFRDFWLDAERLEWKGLWDRGCFKKWKRSDLKADDRVFGSRYHYKIKHCMKTGKISKFKVRMVVQGHRMKEGLDYDDSFAPVPHTTMGRLMMSTAAADNLHLHSVDMTQAFIQADKLDEGVNGRTFITPPPGCEEDEEGVVYEVLLPLYGIPSSARALNLTLAKWFKERGFETVGFEDSVWSRPGGGRYQTRITVSAHIDELLIATADLSVIMMALFKSDFLSRFDGTDEQEVIFDREASSVTLRQKIYAERVLRLYGMWGCATVKTPLEPGTRLSKADSPQHVDAALHHRYSGIVGHLSFLVSCTRPDLAFAYAELSKFVAYPGVTHMRAAERTLQYLMGTYDQGITYRQLDPPRRNVLEGWVDSDYAADPDTRRSVTGSSEAEFVAASQCGVEVVYLRALLKDLGLEQHGPTRVWEDNASCIMMSENPVNRERSRHINTRIYFLRDLVKDGVLKLVKVPGVDNVADALTKSVPFPTLEKHRKYLWGSGVPFTTYWVTVSGWQSLAVYKLMLE
eukprot:1259041-Rhodomonas_salina.4